MKTTRRPATRRARAVAGVVAVLAVCAAPAARADDDTVEQAKASYKAGAEAYDRGDMRAALRELSRADALAPNPVVLELALKCAIALDDAVEGIGLAERAADAEEGSALAELGRTARERFARRVGTLVLACPAGKTCKGNVEGRDLIVGTEVRVSTGLHVVTVDVDGTSNRVLVEVVAGRTHAVEVPTGEAPAPAREPVVPPREPPPREKPLPAWMFWAGAGATVALGAGTIASAVDTSSKHDRFQESPDASLASSGQSAQVRTNLLLGGTALLGVATAAAGIWLVRWKSERAPTVGLGVGPGLFTIRFEETVR